MSIVDSTVIREMLRAVKYRSRRPDMAARQAIPSSSVALTGWLIIACSLADLEHGLLTAPLNGAVVGNAVVKVDGNRKSVQHLDGGIVKELFVREGERVDGRRRPACA